MLLTLTACGAPPEPVDPAQLASLEQRLAAPFQESRIVLTDRLEVRMTANFYARLTRPVVVPAIQDERRTESPDGGSESIYSNRSPAAPLRFILDGVDFRVLREARIIVLGGSHELTLDAVADGNVSVLQGAERRDAPRLTIGTAGGGIGR